MEGHYHFFVSSALNWHAGDNLLSLLADQKRADTAKRNLYHTKGCAVYVVPLPPEAEYKIENYRPVVDGTLLLFEHAYKGVTKLHNAENVLSRVK